MALSRSLFHGFCARALSVTAACALSFTAACAPALDDESEDGADAGGGLLGLIGKGDPVATPSASPAPERPEAGRGIVINGRTATAADLQILGRFERAWGGGVQVPAGAYWYDDFSGAAGLAGGPMRGVLGAGLGLGATMLASASGGGDGRLTGTFINGRELHPLDVQGLTLLFGQPPYLGRFWVDGQGNFGAEGQPAMGNLVTLMRGRDGGGGTGDSDYRSDIGTGSSTFVGSGCAAVHGRLSPSDSDSSYSYYVGCE